MSCSPNSLIDPHGRTIRYLRISVTDRCDLRCRYCMAEQMTFLPRAALLSLDEIAIIAERIATRCEQLGELAVPLRGCCAH